MNFCDMFKNMDYNAIKDAIYLKSEADVKIALEKNRPDYDDFLALLSPQAQGFIEEMALRSNFITKRRFGNVMNLYAPLYLSNECANSCVYCGFNKDNKVKRITLSVESAVKEADFLYNLGIRDVLLVSGDAPKIVSLKYLKEIISKLRLKFASVAVEIYPMETAEYEQIKEAGCDGVTVYQETYDEKLYKELHLGGKKKDFNFRLATPDRAGSAGLRRIGIGILMGLGDWRTDCAIVAAHALHIAKRYWKSKVSVSLPRMRPAAGGFKPLQNISDQNFAQAITALRIYLNDIGIALSTREKPTLRDNLIRLGITQMSAGSKTNPGGYLLNQDSCEQFEVEDKRSVAEVCNKLSELGYDPVFKDWQE